jgi:predicted nucleic acid-binding protein
LRVAYLLDTNVVSELRKSAPNTNVLAWYQDKAETDAYLSVLVIGEIRQGIERLRHRDPRQAESLDRWLLGLLSTYGSRILSVTVEVAHEWGRLNAAHSLPIVNGLLAATAAVHRLTLVTRNVSDMARSGVPVVNPFDRT